MAKKTFRVSDMHCSNCAMKIEALEDDLPGIRSISASYQKAQLVVDYDETKINEAQIVSAVKKQGYTATPLTLP